MSSGADPLTPYPLDMLLGRVAAEWNSRQRIFDLPSARIWKRPPDLDLGFSFLGRPCASPVGPAAGPHSQMTQNIVLAWLGGSRIFELKTVQVLDRLEIGRPCIDMQTIGYNIEWSQELRVEESLIEYVKAWMMIRILNNWEPVMALVGPDPGPFVFDMSVGYDLEGISTEKISDFIVEMKNAKARIDSFRSQIPEPFTHLRDLDFGSRISDTVTLSTFHGCPPHEIDAITKHLMTRHEVDVIVKLNPTLLGLGKVQEILHDTLGYDHIPLLPQAFVDDLQFDQGIELIEGLREFARRHGRRFGIKLSNTLVVGNDKGWMPDDPMYLSGPPLHVITSTLLDELICALPGVFNLAGHGGDVQVSFSAGVSKENLSDTLGMGVAPVTVCSDLLKPGGYGRLAPMLNRLAIEMRQAGAADLGTWHRHKWQLAQESGYRGPVEAHMMAMSGGKETHSYHLSANEKLPRAVDNVLEMWGCVACNFCVTVCPNDAVIRLATVPELQDELTDRWQYFILAELCNECGNCLTFCPEEGDPAVIKPRLFVDRDRFEADQEQGFFLMPTADRLGVLASPGWEKEVAPLTAMLNGARGLPLRTRELST